MKCSRDASGVFFEELDFSQTDNMMSSPTRPHTHSLALKQKLILPTEQEEDARSVGFSWDSANPQLALQQATTPSEVCHPQSLSGVSSRKIMPMQSRFCNSKCPEFVPEQLRPESGLSHSEGQDPKSNSERISQSGCRLLLVEFERDEVFAAFYKDLKTISEVESRITWSLIRRGKLF